MAPCCHNARERPGAPPPPPKTQVAYHAKEIPGMTCAWANPPVAVREDLGAVMSAIKAKFPDVK